MSRNQMSSPENEDFFDPLPDSLLLLIFNKLCDSRSLAQCLLVSKRFSSLVFQADNVFLSIPTPKPKSASSHRNRASRNLLRTLVHKFIAKPLQFFPCVAAPKSPGNSGCISYYSPNEVLKHLKNVKSLHIKVPFQCEKIGLECSNSLLKWQAEFSGELKNCVVLSATSIQECNCCINHVEEGGGGGTVGQVLNDDELKLRIVTTISCLIAASARHLLLKQILAEHHMLENVTISDVNKQGRLCVGKDQIVEMRNAMKSLAVSESSSSIERTPVPDLSMKLWYVPVLELPATGYLMKGATLVVIKPVNGVTRKGSNQSDSFDFDGDKSEKMAFVEAARMMVKMKKSYAMTMNSF
ncbi:F-box protein At4g18380 [Ricinus communis]|uniref:F-box protein At4g18380 n=1 Tax=Ricinus communis TaxID=3988 RepID=UPI00201A8317|nr:F-box protein At4g18380 [Ricinus communis]